MNGISAPAVRKVLRPHKAGKISRDKARAAVKKVAQDRVRATHGD